MEALAAKYNFELKFTEYDTEIDSTHDVTQDTLWSSILIRIKGREFHVIFVTPPCSSFSRVRFASSMGPRPIRDRQHPWGYPWLSVKMRAEATLANTLVLQTVEACAAASEAEAFYLVEHPEDLGVTALGHHPAAIWQLAEVRKLSVDTNASTFACFQCAFGAPTSKPTRFLTTLPAAATHPFQGWPRLTAENKYIGPLPQQCPHGGHQTKLIGQVWSPEKQRMIFRTGPAANYPPALCQQLAQWVVDSVMPSLKQGPPSTTTSSPSGTSSNAFPPEPPALGEPLAQVSLPANLPPVPSIGPLSRVPQAQPALATDEGTEEEEDTPSKDEEMAETACTSDEESDGEPRVKDRPGGQGPALKSPGKYGFQDGCGLCSPGRWHPSTRKAPSEMGTRLRELIVGHIRSKFSNPGRVVLEMAVGKVDDKLWDDRSLRCLREAWFGLLEDPSAASHVQEFQPFYLEALSQTLKACGDPDWRVMCHASQNYKAGVPVGFERRLPRTPSVFPRKVRWRKYNDSTFEPEMDNYQTAVVTGDFLRKELEAEEALGMVFRISLAQARLQYGSRWRVAAWGALDK